MVTHTSRRTFLKVAVLSLTGAAGALTATPARPAYGEGEPGPSAWFKAPEGSKRIALTFDDGYVNVAGLLDAAQAADVRLTLFPTGKAILDKPAVWQRAVSEGHELGCHTFSHAALGSLCFDAVVNEIEQWKWVAREQLGLHDVRFLRPPYGDGWNAETVRRAAATTGLQIAMWNRVNSMKQRSATPGPDEVVEGFVAEARAGDIFLGHFLWQEVVALPGLVAHAREQGWQCVTLSQLLAGRPKAQARLTSAMRP
ncbi:MAG TPA: polysaccharide deacetylase family protein [Anaerolineales bacterium]|nr:polysaccharide deacetylase family protein [Anaerolineales bacterium]